MKALSALLVFAALAGLTPGLARAQASARACLAPPESRAAVADNRLIRPFAALRFAAGLTGAEPVAAKLCQWGGQFVYEIVLLHRDGRTANVFVDAATGNVVASRAAPK